MLAQKSIFRKCIWFSWRLDPFGLFFPWGGGEIHLGDVSAQLPRLSCLGTAVWCQLLQPSPRWFRKENKSVCVWGGRDRIPVQKLEAGCLHGQNGGQRISNPSQTFWEVTKCCNAWNVFCHWKTRVLRIGGKDCEIACYLDIVLWVIFCQSWRARANVTVIPRDLQKNINKKHISSDRFAQECAYWKELIIQQSHRNENRSLKNCRTLYCVTRPICFSTVGVFITFSYTYYTLAVCFVLHCFPPTRKGAVISLQQKRKRKKRAF